MTDASKFIKELAPVSIDETTEESLTHHGVLGMKWGVRKDGMPQGYQGSRKKTVTRQDIGGKNKKVTEKKAAKLDRKFEKKALSNKNYLAVYNHVAKQMNNRYIDEINAKYDKYDFSKENFNKPSPKYKQYLDEYKNKTTALYNAASKELIGTNATGTARVEFSVKQAGAFPEFRIAYSDDVKHSSENTRPTTIKLKWHEGKIVGLRLVDDSDSTDEELLHYGVLGMKWGVRKDGLGRGGRGPGVSKKKTSTKPIVKKTSAFIKEKYTSYKNDTPVKRLAREGLSNKQIQDRNQRMRLELDYIRLKSDLSKFDRTKGQKFVDDVLKRNGSEVLTRLAKDKAMYKGRQYLGLPTGEKKKDKDK